LDFLEGPKLDKLVQNLEYGKIVTKPIKKIYKNFMPNTNIQPPRLTNNPSWDVVVTEIDPRLSFFNAVGDSPQRKYELQLDTNKNFNSGNLRVYQDIPETDFHVTDQKIPATEPLADKKVYYWRVRTVTEKGHSDWAVSRFHVDTRADKKFMNLVRVPVKNTKVSNGYNAKNITDWDDPGLLSFWQSPPPGDNESWIEFDLGEVREISRVWMLSNFSDQSGWLKDFVWQVSTDGKKWAEIVETATKNNDTFRNIIDFSPVRGRYFRLLIKSFTGYAAQINEIILYAPGQPPVPAVPSGNYVLVVGNEHNGFTFTELAKYIETLPGGIKTVTVPCFEMSPQLLAKLSHPPRAIILSGNNADYPNLPMFEYNGEFEIIRNTSIPLLGICAGHQFLAMAYGYTRARSMGWSDISALEPKQKMTRIKINKKDPIFAGMRDNFTAPEVHSWAVAEPGPEFEVIASSDYVQVQKSTKRLIYGVQFHPEIKVSYNHGAKVIENFLKLASKVK
jgi:GMP synthase-like glutamine amidotransferase